MTAEELIEQMQKLRMYVCISLPTEGGCRTEQVKLENLIEFIERSHKHIAEIYGITEQQYRKFLETGGIVRCTAICKDGRDCGNSVAECWTPDEWLELKGKFCVQHRRRETRRRKRREQAEKAAQPETDPPFPSGVLNS
jgi:hypothetical protein